MIDLDECIWENVRYSYPLELKEWRRMQLLMESKSVPDVTDECAECITAYASEQLRNLVKEQKQEYQEYQIK